MHWSAIVRRLRTLFDRQAVEREMDDELQLHLEMSARDLERRGLAPHDATRAATISFGGIEATKEVYRDARGVRIVEDLAQDVRYAVRTLRRRPVFAIVATLTMALGVGAATSIYSIVDGVLFRPLPFANAARIVQIWQTYPDWKTDPILAPNADRIELSLPEYRDLRNKTTAFSHIGVWADVRETLVDGDQRERVMTTRASASLLDVLGVRPFVGRSFLPDEDRPGAAAVAMVSYEMWQTRYAGARDVVGRTIHLDERAYTIIGVLPPALTLGRRAALQRAAPALWIPAGANAGADYEDRESRNYNAIARLAPGVTMERAEQNVRAVPRDPSTTRNVETRLVEWQRDQTRDARRPLLLLLAGVAVLLLIACVNVATLLLGEAAAREHEMAARIALGAGRRRIIRQLLTESLTLAALGGALGVAVAWAGMRALVAIAPVEIPGMSDVRLDGRVIVAALLAVSVTGIVFGLAPTLTLSRTGPSSVFRRGAGQSARGRGAMQRVMIAIELALSVVLLAGAGVLARTFHNISSRDPGFRPEHLIFMNSALPRSLRDSIGVHRIYEDAAARVAALPGVAGAVIGTEPPFMGGSGSASFALEGEVLPAAGGSTDATVVRRHRAHYHAVGPGYFALFGVPLLAGRELQSSDRWGAPNVVVVSASLARRDFPAESPLGKRIRRAGVWWTIVGVVGDVPDEKLSHPIEPAIYSPFAQDGGAVGPTLIVRTNGAAPSTAVLQTALRQANAKFMVTAVYTSEGLIEQSFADERFRAMLMSMFAVLAAVLSTVGMYGVTARAVAGRTREVGIRIALGATTSSVVRTLMRQTMSGAAIGVAVGLGLAWFATRALAPFLFGVSATDPFTFVGITTLLGLTAALASWLPSRRVSRLDITAELRAE